MTRPSDELLIDLKVSTEEPLPRALHAPVVPSKRSTNSRVRLSVQLAKPAAALLPLRIFIGVGWLRSFAEKAMSGTWGDGSGVGVFLDAQVASGWVVFPFYQGWIDGILRPGSRWVAWLVMLIELVVGLAIISGFYTNAALLAAGLLNVNFMLAGRISPSVFYIGIQAVLFIMGVGGILGVDGSEWSRRGKYQSILLVAKPEPRGSTENDASDLLVLAVAAAGVGWLGFSHASDFSPSGVTDPGLVLGAIMTTCALSLVVFAWSWTVRGRRQS